MLLGILGLYMLYSIGHFLVIQHTTAYKERTTYERITTWAGIAFIVIIILGVMFP